ncbi:MAG: HAD-IIIA family hydrolase [Planctomycetota bacterium]
MTKPAVFLDRDNTLIRNDGDLGDPEKVELLQGVSTAVASLRGLGYRIVVVTNQGGVARGKYGESDVKAVHQRVAELVEGGANGARIDAFYYCPYHPQGRLKQYMREHPNRKPSPGMLLEAAADLDLDLSRSWMIGDQMRDVQAGSAAGCRTVLLRADAAELSPLDVASTEGVTAMTPTQTPGAVEASTGVALAPAAVKPDFLAASLIDAVRIVAQARQPEATAEERATGPVNVPRKWDAAAVAQLQRQSARPGGRSDPKPAEDTPPAAGGKRSATRPFRPWGVADGEPRETYAPASPAAAADQPVDASVAGEHVTDIPGPIAAELARRASAKPTHEPVEPVAVNPEEPDAEPASSTRLLRAILQELRGQRAVTGGVTWLVILAVVLQMGAVFCVAGAMWMGAASVELFARWAFVGVMAQLGVVAMLLFDGRRG